MLNFAEDAWVSRREQGPHYSIWAVQQASSSASVTVNKDDVSAADYAANSNLAFRTMKSSADGFLHTKSGCFQQRINLLQRFGFAMRASS